MSDVAGVTRLQQKMWATGDFHRVGVQQIIVGERLAGALHIHSGEKVLDVAGGAGNTALAAARRWADVTCSDYVPDLLVHAAERAQAELLPLRTEVADAQELPYPDGLYDVVTSTFGAMFAPDQTRTANELLRVLRRRGRLGLANWTPQGWVGSHLRLTAEFRQGTDLPPPTSWGTREGLAALFGAGTESLTIRERSVDVVYHSAAALFDLFLESFGPTALLWPSLDRPAQEAFRSRWIALADELNTATDGTLCIPSTYLEVVAVKKDS